MGWKQYPIRCMICGEETALVGEDIDKKYTMEHFAAEGWVFSKYKTMCPECRKKESERFEQMTMEVDPDA